MPTYQISKALLWFIKCNNLGTGPDLSQKDSSNSLWKALGQRTGWKGKPQDTYLRSARSIWEGKPDKTSQLQTRRAKA
jgi:hypothetical protein